VPHLFEMLKQRNAERFNNQPAAQPNNTVAATDANVASKHENKTIETAAATDTVENTAKVATEVSGEAAGDKEDSDIVESYEGVKR